MSENKSQAQILKEQLFYKAKNTYNALSDEDIAAAYDYAEGYKKYLDAGKIERECVKESIKMLEAEGFVPTMISSASGAVTDRERSSLETSVPFS